MKKKYMKRIFKKVFIKLGNFFKCLMRYCYSKAGGVCWNCGCDCGFDSIISHGLFWCTHCHNRWGWIKKPFKISWRGIGITPKKNN